MSPERSTASRKSASLATLRRRFSDRVLTGTRRFDLLGVQEEYAVHGVPDVAATPPELVVPEPMLPVEEDAGAVPEDRAGVNILIS